jgi:hypothetical protein
MCPTLNGIALNHTDVPSERFGNGEKSQHKSRIAETGGRTRCFNPGYLVYKYLFGCADCTSAVTIQPEPEVSKVALRTPVGANEEQVTEKELDGTISSVTVN